MVNSLIDHLLASARSIPQSYYWLGKSNEVSNVFSFTITCLGHYVYVVEHTYNN